MMCIEGSFGGACGSFTCSGDAVQCATAKASNELLCSLKVDPTNSIVQAGLAAMNGGQGEGHPRASISDVSVGSLDQSNPWGSTCPSNQTLGVFMGKAVVLPLSSACGTFQAMGALLVGVALLAGAFIVVRGS